jgi:hypothetical protein
MERQIQVPGSLIFSQPQLNLKDHFGGVAQLVRARGSYPRRRRFESAHRHQNSPLDFHTLSDFTKLSDLLSYVASRRFMPRNLSQIRPQKFAQI